MNVIEIFPVKKDQQALNGWFSNSGCGYFKSAATCPKVQTRKANDEIDVIRSEEGVNDLMYMKPEQAIKVVNRVLERVSFKQAWSKAQISKFKAKDSIRAFEDANKIYGEAIGTFMSEFRQYAIGMDGELQKIGSSKKKTDGIEFETPYYKLVLPQKVQGTNPVDGVSKDELLTILQNQNGNSLNTSSLGSQSKTALYLGIGVGVLALTGGIIYIVRNKK